MVLIPRRRSCRSSSAPWKAPHLALDDMKVAGLRQSGHERAQFLRHSAGRTRHRLVDRRGGRVCEVLGEVDPDEDDLGLGGAKSFREAFADRVGSAWSANGKRSTLRWPRSASAACGSYRSALKSWPRRGVLNSRVRDHDTGGSPL